MGLPEGCAAAWRLLDDKPEEAASEKKDMEVEQVRLSRTCMRFHPGCQGTFNNDTLSLPICADALQEHLGLTLAAWAQVQGSAGDRDEEEAGPSQPAEEKSEDGGTGPSSSDASGRQCADVLIHACMNTSNSLCLKGCRQKGSIARLESSNGPETVQAKRMGGARAEAGGAAGAPARRCAGWAAGEGHLATKRRRPSVGVSLLAALLYSCGECEHGCGIQSLQ